MHTKVIAPVIVSRPSAFYGGLPEHGGADLGCFEARWLREITMLTLGVQVGIFQCKSEAWTSRSKAAHKILPLSNIAITMLFVARSSGCVISECFPNKEKSMTINPSRLLRGIRGEAGLRCASLSRVVVWIWLLLLPPS
jgi:hypothetical protein